MTSKIPYDHTLFVGRVPLIEEILTKVCAGLGKAMQLSGPKGSGKSWLLWEVARQGETRDPGNLVACHLDLTREGPSPLACSLCLAPPRTAEAPEDATGQILEHLARRLCPGAGLSGGIDRRSWQLLEKWAQDNRRLALLVDGIDELDPPFLRLLEKYVLAPFTQQHDCSIVLGGRVRNPSPGGGFVWDSTELRTAAEIVLPPLEREETAEQLRRLAAREFISPYEEGEAGDIWALGGGYPFNNHILAARWPEVPSALQDCADTHLAEAPPEARDGFWALCVLEEFDDYRMGPLLDAWSACKGNLPPPNLQHCRRIRTAMVKTRLAKWDGDRGAYVMDAALRKVLQEALRANEPACWQALHRAAYELYRGWAASYPDPRWNDLRDYHQQQLPAKAPAPAPGT